jgi:hypothetical protein
MPPPTGPDSEPESARSLKLLKTVKVRLSDVGDSDHLVPAAAAGEPELQAAAEPRLRAPAGAAATPDFPGRF